MWSCIKKVNPTAKKINLIGFEKYTVLRLVIGKSNIIRCVVEYENKRIQVTGEIIENILWVSKKQLQF